MSSIEDLFEISRFPPWSLSTLALLVYSPVGLMLAVLRIFIGIQAFIAATVLPKSSLLRRFVLRVMCTLLGFVVVQDNPKPRDFRARILVANYTSVVDRLAVELVFPCIMPSMWNLPSLLNCILGYTDMGAKDGRETLIVNAKKHCQESRLPLLAFPEGATTSGKVGLLKFSVWPFSLDQPVQPMAVRVVRPLFTAGLLPSVVDSHWWVDLLWFLFVPYSCFHIQLLPAVEPSSTETSGQFSVRAQRLIADALHISATSLTCADKMDFIKQLHTRRQPADGGAGSEVDTMVCQVLSVLPYVPADVIRQDLALTKDVDLTISNLLDGRTTFSAAPADDAGDQHGRDDDDANVIRSPNNLASSLTRQSGMSSSEGGGGAVVDRKSSTFGHTSTERHRSLSDRKHTLIESARQRYIDKHTLDMTS